nr:hypothetical protein [Tanacetum cinerariifolium]
MDMTIDQQVELDEARIPHASRLRIRKSNFHLRSDITSKELTLQLVYDVRRLTPFFKAFLVTANTFDELPFEDEILVFLRYFRHSGEIRKITDVNINKLHQPWRSFAAVINKCLSTRLSTLTKGKQPAKSSKAKDEGTGSLPRVLDVPTDESDEEISWKSSDEDDDDDRSDDQEDENDQDEDDQDDDDQDENDDDQDTDNDGDNFVHPKLSIHEEEAKDKESFDPIVQTSKNSNDEGNNDVSLASTIVAPLTLTAPTLPSPTIPTISQVPQAPTPPTTVPSTFLQDLLIFGLLFGFDHHLKTLEANFFKFVQRNQFARAVSSIPRIVERYMDQRMNEAVKAAVQLQYDRLQDEAQAENEDFINKLDENIQNIIKEQVNPHVKVQVSKILPKIKKTVNEQLEAEVLTRSSNSSKTSYAMAADLSELELKKILIEKMESNKSIHRSDEQMESLQSSGRCL